MRSAWAWASVAASAAGATPLLWLCGTLQMELTDRERPGSAASLIRNADFSAPQVNFLGVLPEDVPAKVAAVRRSGAGERVLAYRRERGLAGFSMVMKPGATQLTVMPRLAISWARLLLMPIMPALDAA